MTSFYARRLEQIELELNACQNFLTILSNLQLVGVNLKPSQEEEKRRIEQDMEILLKSKDMWTIVASNYPVKREKVKDASTAKSDINRKKDKTQKFYKERLNQIETELEACVNFKRVLQKMHAKGLLTDVQKLELTTLEEDIKGLQSNQDHWRRIAENERNSTNSQDSHVIFTRETVVRLDPEAEKEKQNLSRNSIFRSRNSLAQTISFASFRSRGSDWGSNARDRISCCIIIFAVVLIIGVLTWVILTSVVH